MIICLPFRQYLAQNLRGSTFLEASCQLQSVLRSPANDPIHTTMKMIYDLKNSVPEEEKMKPNIKICGWWMEHLSPWDIHHYPGNTSRHSRGLKVFGISELAALQKKIACLHKSSIIDQQKLTTFAKKQHNKLNDTWDTYRVRARQSANTEAWLSLLSGRSLQFISFSCLDFKHHSIKDCSSFFQYLLSWGEDGQP